MRRPRSNAVIRTMTAPVRCNREPSRIGSRSVATQAPNIQNSGGQEKKYIGILIMVMAPSFTLGASLAKADHEQGMGCRKNMPLAPPCCAPDAPMGDGRSGLAKKRTFRRQL